MSKKIIVAGAGHGGVIAAAKLAKAGFDVTVYEKQKRENIGHDWEDRFDFQTVLNAIEKDEMPDGVDFVFDNAVIQSSDLAGAGRNMNFKALLMKFVSGMKQPKYFFQIIHGLIKGGKTAKLMKSAPKKYDEHAINRWQKKIEKQRVEIRWYNRYY